MTVETLSGVVMGSLKVVRWKRHGHDRLYVNLPDGIAVAWMDCRTGKIEILDERHRREALGHFVCTGVRSRAVRRVVRLLVLRHRRGRRRRHDQWTREGSRCPPYLRGRTWPRIALGLGYLA